MKIRFRSAACQTVLATTVMLVLGAMVFGKLWHPHKAHFSDAHDYVLGLRAHAAGRDAYGMAPGDVPTGFIYPPVVLELAVMLASALPHALLWTTYLSLSLMCVFCAPWLLSGLATGEMDQRSRWFVPATAAVLLVAEPNLFSLTAALSGNVNVLLLTGLLCAGLLSIRNGSFALLYLAIFVSALFKPPFLAFLLLPLLAGNRQLGKAAMTAVSVVSVYALERLLVPELYASFQASVRTELVAHRDYGLGLFALIYEHTAGRFPCMQWKGSLLAHALVISAFVLVFWSGRRVRREHGLSSLWAPAVLILCMLANPRPLSYDLYLAWPLAVYVVLEWLRTARNRRERVLSGSAVACFLTALGCEDPEMISAGMLLASIALVAVRIFQGTRFSHPLTTRSSQQAALQSESLEAGQRR